MGQYYLLVNEDRQEYLHPRQIDSGAKLFEICANNLPRVLPYLLRQSDGYCVGDPQDQPTDQLGRWAGDRVVLIGNHDRSDLYQLAESGFSEISNEIRPEINEFLPEYQQLDQSIDGGHGSSEFITE